MQDYELLAPLPTETWDPSLDHIVADMKGLPINVHKLMAHHPQLLTAWWSFRNYSVTGGELGRRRGELVILRTALRLRAWYEWGSHVERGLAAGLTREEIERVKEGGQAPGWDSAEGLLLIAVDRLFDDKGLSETLLKELGAHYSTKEIMDLMAIHGMYVILGSMINTWGLELDARTQAKLPSDVTQEAFEAEFPR
ncbi:MAG: carboxymuconolactone decarboxylase family protein [Rhodospirillales bacterium]